MNSFLLRNSQELELFIQKKDWQPIIVADERVAHLYGAPIHAPMITFPSGEVHKNRDTKAELENRLLELGISQATCIVGFGGGVALDMAGFIAATLHRGVHLTFIPTTLLAMVDASLGGKNGVNTPFGKNLIGTVYHPEAIAIDTSYLHTLGKLEITCGTAEMIKHALLADPAMLQMLEPIDYELIVRNLMIKRSFIEKGDHRRHCLNFGHTIGHALEALSSYALPHGLAILKGMWVEALLSSCEDLETIGPYVDKTPIDYSADEIWEYLSRDKKSVRGIPHIVALKKIGEPRPLYPITKEALADVLSYARQI